jgi:hypothetical protein
VTPYFCVNRYFTLQLSFFGEVFVQFNFLEKTPGKCALTRQLCPNPHSRARVSARHRARRHAAPDHFDIWNPQPQRPRTGLHHRARPRPDPPRSPWSTAAPCVEPPRRPLPPHAPPPGFPVLRAALLLGPPCHGSALSKKGDRHPLAIQGAHPFLPRARDVCRPPLKAAGRAPISSAKLAI